MSDGPDRGMCIRLPREMARDKLEEQIEKGDYLIQLHIRTYADLEVAKDGYNRWRAYIVELLLNLFSTDRMYIEFVHVPTNIPPVPTLAGERSSFRENLSKEVNQLRSIVDRLEFFEEDIAAPSVTPSKNAEAIRKKELVFVVHGRNEKLKDSIFNFLRAIRLDPREWPELKAEAMRETRQGTPYVGTIVQTALEQAQGVVVLLSGDDEARLRSEFLADDDPPYEKELTPQARPNVLFEAGMAMGCCQERTVFVQVGKVRVFSDTVGRHVIHLNDSAEKRHELVQTLKTIGCGVDESGNHWMKVGSFAEEPYIRKRDTSGQHSTGVSRQPATKDETALMARVRGFRGRMQRALEQGNFTLAPDFAVELNRLLLDAMLTFSSKGEVSSLRTDFQTLATAHVKDKEALLKSTLNSADRLLSEIEQLS